MTSDQKYEGRGNFATQPGRNGSNIEQTANKEGLAANSTPQPVHVRADIAIHPHISLHARYKTSSLDVMAFALEEYRQDRIKNSINQFLSGDHENAYNDLMDAETASNVLFDLLLSASELADKNYWASRGETPERPAGEESGFDEWIKSVRK